MSEQAPQLTPDQASSVSETRRKEHKELSELVQARQLESSVAGRGHEDMLKKAAETARNNLKADVTNNRTKTEVELIGVTDERLAQATKAVTDRIQLARRELTDAQI